MSISTDQTPMTVTVWGPVISRTQRRTERREQRAARRMSGPRPRHIVGGLLGAALMPLLAVLPAAYIALSADPDLSQDPLALTTEVTRLISQTGPGLAAAMLLTWLGLSLPVLLAGRRDPRGIAGMVGWGFSWRTDLKIAVVFAVVLRSVEQLVGLLLTRLGVDTDALGNSDMLTAAGHGWLVVLGLGAAVGAPVTEELFFRGLVLQVAARKFGPVLGVVASSMLFGLMHAQATAAATAYTVTSTAVVGAGLALLVLRTGRLGTSIVSHAVFNASAVLLMLIAP